MGRLYHSSDEFLMLCVQNVCAEPILISLNPTLTEFVMMLVSPPHRHLLMIYHQLRPDHIRILESTITKRVLILTNRADPDETPHFASSHPGLRCLYMFLFSIHSACSTNVYFEF